MHYSQSIAISKREIITSRAAISTIGVISFALLTWLGAGIYIPLGFTPVPITLQTFFVFLSGAILGKRLGSLSQSIYLLAGSIGMPIFFSGSFGFLYLFGPTGGYLVGFIAASWVIGCMLQDRDSIGHILAAFIIGAVVIFSCGAGWLAFGLRLGIKQAVYLGILPFMPGCIIKILAASVITKSYIKRSKQLFY